MRWVYIKWECAWRLELGIEHGRLVGKYGKHESAALLSLIAFIIISSSSMLFLLACLAEWEF